jgi:hypothetical protein
VTGWSVVGDEAIEMHELGADEIRDEVGVD